MDGKRERLMKISSCKNVGEIRIDAITFAQFLGFKPSAKQAELIFEAKLISDKIKIIPSMVVYYCVGKRNKTRNASSSARGMRSGKHRPINYKYLFGDRVMLDTKWIEHLSLNHGDIVIETRIRRNN